MARITKVCRVCGKEYEFCRTPRVDGVYHWQEVACCPEHGAIYLERVLRSRGIMTDESASVESELVANESDLEASDEPVELFDDDEEDGYEDADEEFNDEEDELDEII